MQIHKLTPKEWLKALGVDRHAPINQGRCGRSCFRVIVNTPAFAAVPKILETPKGPNDKGVPWDLVNIRRLRRMVRRI